MDPRRHWYDCAVTRYSHARCDRFYRSPMSWRALQMAFTTQAWTFYRHRLGHVHVLGQQLFRWRCTHGIFICNSRYDITTFLFVQVVWRPFTSKRSGMENVKSDSLFIHGLANKSFVNQDKLLRCATAVKRVDSTIRILNSDQDRIMCWQNVTLDVTGGGYTSSLPLSLIRLTGVNVRTSSRKPKP